MTEEQLKRHLESLELNTPEEIVALLGNISNRPDVRMVQEFQVEAIKKYAKTLVISKEYLVPLFIEVAKTLNARVLPKENLSTAKEMIRNEVFELLSELFWEKAEELEKGIL